MEYLQERLSHVYLVREPSQNRAVGSYTGKEYWLNTKTKHLHSLLILMLNVCIYHLFLYCTESARDCSIPILWGSQIPIWCVELGHLPNLKQNRYYPTKILKIIEVWPKICSGLYEIHLFPFPFFFFGDIPTLWFMEGRYVENKWFSWYCLMITV